MAGPSDTVDQLTQAINRGDLEAALALYEPNAVLVVQPGHLACGTTQLREALAGFIALEPTVRSEAQEVIGAGGLSLYPGRGTPPGGGPAGPPPGAPRPRRERGRPPPFARATSHS